MYAFALKFPLHDHRLIVSKRPAIRVTGLQAHAAARKDHEILPTFMARSHSTLFRLSGQVSLLTGLTGIMVHGASGTTWKAVWCPWVLLPGMREARKLLTNNESKQTTP